MLSPIVLFVYNRPWHTQQTIEALQKNDLALQSDLIIYSDAPKNESGKRAVQDVRRYIKGVEEGFKTISIVERDENWGLANSIIDGVTSIVNEFGRIIVLEDDLVTSPFFLRYMNEALDFYQDDDRVISIHGWMWPHKNKNNFSPFFLKGADCWGWATWKRGWDLFDSDGEKMLSILNAEPLAIRKIFDFNGEVQYIKMLEQQIAGKNDSWAIRWYASAFLNEKLTLHPGISLVQNIGNDSSGTHCSTTDLFKVPLAETSIDIKNIPVNEDINMRKEAEEYYKNIQPSFLQRGFSMLDKLFGTRQLKKYVSGK